MDLNRGVKPDPRRSLPSVDRLTREVLALRPDLPEWAVVAAVRAEVDESRGALELLLSRGAKNSEIEDVIGTDWSVQAIVRARKLSEATPAPVINATGVVLHTNLGRAPLSAEAARAAAEAAANYSNLEFDLETGHRGNRLGALTTKLELLSGAEAAMVVNNNAAAVMLALDTVAAGKEVIVSRGELVEIGGSFRVPAIMEKAGVRLVEVGTTNRTHPDDYAAAIGPETGLLLKVHRSNFAQSGFVAEVDLGQLVEIGRRHGVPVVEDLGAGTLVDLSRHGFPADAFVPSRLRLGPDLVCFSGDKLFGGPQAGILLGSRRWVDELRKNPLARALRLDKMTIAALDATVDAMLRGRAEQEIPALRQMLEAPESLAIRARALAERLERVAGDRIALTVEEDRVPVGGGSLPGFELPTFVVSIRAQPGGPGPQRIADGLRAAPRPVLARVRDDAVLLDLRTLSEADLDAVTEALEAALR